MFRIKICGITTVSDAAMVAEAGADAIGLNFFAESPRFVDASTAHSIVTSLPNGIVKVGVFVNPSRGEVEACCRDLGLDFAQLHGDRTEVLLRELDARRVIVAVPFSVRRVPEVRQRLAAWDADGVRPAGLLIDADRDGMHGGTGVTIDWHLAAEFRKDCLGIPLILAGGLHPEIVAEAVRVVRPDAVDVASGVESAPGRKDAARVRAFVDAVAKIR